MTNYGMPSVSVAEGSETEYEKYIAGTDVLPFKGDQWNAQTFNSSVTHILTKQYIWLKKDVGILDASHITLRLRATATDGKPTGSDLDSSLLHGVDLSSAVYQEKEFVFSGGIVLYNNVLYALVLDLDEDGVNFVRTERSYLTGSYAKGSEWGSVDGGVTWSTHYSTSDIDFRDYGKTPARTIIGSIRRLNYQHGFGVP